MRRMIFAAPLVVLLAGTTGFAQTAAQPLSGPKVAAPAPKTSLIERGLDGKVRRLEVPAEEAALDLLTMTEEENAKVETVMTERNAILDKVVGQNIEILLRLQGLQAEGPSRQDAQAALRELVEKLQPLRERGSLRDEVAGAMSADNAAKFRTLVEEYWKAVADEAVAEAKKEDPNAAPARVVARVRLQAVGQEIRRSYDRKIASGKNQLDQAVAKLGLTPEQEDKVRNMATDYFQKTLGKATPQQRREFFQKLMRELTPAQRQALLSELYGS